MGHKDRRGERRASEKRRKLNDGAAVSIATDCSGLESAVSVLRNLLGKNDVAHVFGCDNNPDVKKFVLQNFTPATWYDDISSRCHSTAEGADIYVAGPPCQPFSSAGRRRGTSDVRGRIILDVMAYVVTAKPSAVLLENVAGMLHRKFRGVYQWIKSVLKANGYEFHRRLLNTCDHGVPQHRPRVYFVALLADRVKHRWSWHGTRGCQLHLCSGSGLPA